MINEDDEEEIKIEYFDSFEVDPLRENNKEIKIDKLDWNISSDTFNQQEPEIIVNWHKQVNELGKYLCKFCDLSYSTVQTLRNHMRVKHTQYYHDIKNTLLNRRRKHKVKCHICMKTFENINDLEQHTHLHSLSNTQNSCLLCLATFKDHNDLLNHMTSKHELLKKLHICTVCGYSTPKISNYKKHVNIHTGINKLKCSYCPYTTNYQPNMKIHERIHSSDKPYTCKFNGCEYSSKTLPALRSHQLLHNKEKHMLYCDKCSYCTVYKINLKKHIDTHWKKKLSENNRLAK